MFVFKKSKKRNESSTTTSKKTPKKRKRKTKDTKTGHSEGNSEVSASGKVWSRASEIFSNLQKDMFSDVLEAVVKFTEGKRGELAGAKSGENDLVAKIAGKNDVIPTCALLTGVNLPDHGDLFRLLALELQTRVSPHVASLKSKRDGVNLRSLVTSTVNQLILNEEVEDELEVKKTNLVFPTLQSWYEDQYGAFEDEEEPSPSKKSKKDDGSAGGQSDNRKPLIIILEDLEGFSAPLLQDYVVNLM